MHSLLQDLRYSLRQRIESPGFTLTAMISLALGIGATTAVFRVIYAGLPNDGPTLRVDLPQQSLFELFNNSAGRRPPNL
jgi:hypothetical protein